MKKQEHYVKVTKYYYPNGDEFDGTAISWHIHMTLFFFISWILFPILWFMNVDSLRGYKKSYFIKEK